jgi:Carboxypeptidase regulatory-like domain/TonB dependent receptor
MPTSHPFRHVFGAAVIGWLALASPVLAQSMLGGVVRDPNGQVAADVTVVAENEKTGEIAEARSSRIGLFAFYHLPPGIYTIRVNHPPLTFFEAGLKVLPAQKRALDITLRIGREERITIDGAAASLATLADGSAGARFSQRAIEALPLVQGRTLQAVVSLVPGVVVTDSTGTLAQFTAAGQRRLANRLTIDGISADLAVDTAGPGIGEAGSGALPAIATTGGTQTLVPLAAVEEIQVRTSAAAPEHARAEGASTVVLTRSGSDRLSGSAFIEGRPDALAARDWFANAGRAPQRKTRMLDLGLSIGGPLWPGRVQSLIVAERQQIDRPLFTSIAVPSGGVRETSGAAVRSVLDAYPLPNVDAAGGGEVGARTDWFPVSSRYATVSARVDATINTRVRAFLRVNRGRSSGDELAPEPVPLRPRLSFTHREATTTNTTTAGLSSQWSTVLHELRVGISSHRGTLDASAAPGSQALPLDLFAPGADDAWIAVSLAPASVLMHGRTASAAQEQVQIGQTLTIARGPHQWRIGGDYLRARSSADAAPQRYAYTFLGVADLQQARVRSVLVSEFAPAAAQRESWAVFAQDQVRVAPRLSVNLGARYVVQPAPTSRTNLRPTLASFEALPNFERREDDGPLWRTVRRLSPHVSGALQLVTADAWQMTAHAGWSLRAGELTSPGMTPFGRGAPYMTRRRIGVTTFPVPAAVLATGGVALPSEHFAFPRDLRAPSVQQWHVSIEQALGHAQRVSLGYAGAAGRDLIYAHGIAIPAARAFVRGFSNDGASAYHALLAQYVRRLSGRWSADVAYTWSRTIDNDSGEALLPLPPPSLLPPDALHASADYDRPHVIHAALRYRLPWDWQIDAIVSVQSGAPINVTTDRELGGAIYSVAPDVVPGVPLWIPDSLSVTGERINADALQTPTTAASGTLGRNALRAAPLRQLDLSLSRRFALAGSLTLHTRVDAFNVLNTANPAAPEARMALANFGRPEQLRADALGTGSLTRGGLTPVQQLGGPRAVQLGVRLDW